MTTQLIPIVSGQINGQTALVVNARDLHAGLEVGKDFSTWIKDRIQQYGFIENQDFRVFTDFGENPEGGLHLFPLRHDREAENGHQGQHLYRDHPVADPLCSWVDLFDLAVNDPVQELSIVPSSL